MRRIASRAATRTDKLNKQQVTKQMKRALGVSKVEDPSTARTRATFTKQNVALIKTIGPQHFNSVEKAVREGFARGASSKTLKKELIAISGVTQRRAAVIARDQTASLNANFTKQRYAENDITQFTWRTVDDERTREEHERLDGQVFTVAKGAPGEGFPGDPIQCRCFPEPFLGKGKGKKGRAPTTLAKAPKPVQKRVAKAQAKTEDLAEELENLRVENKRARKRLATKRAKIKKDKAELARLTKQAEEAKEQRAEIARLEKELKDTRTATKSILTKAGIRPSVDKLN